MKHFSIAGLQLALGPGDNRDRIAREVASVIQRFPWVQMVVLPELASFGAALAPAETLPGPTEARYQALARRLGIWLVPGSLYERDGERIYNTAVAIDPAGTTVARYRKIYPFLPYETGVSHGTEAVVFDVPRVGRFGLSICYDQWFPEVSRALAWKGAEVILHPTLTGTIDRAQELVLAQANAIVNQCYFIDINSTGGLGNGRSIIVGPEGEVLHQAGEHNEVMPVTLDLERVRVSRTRGIKGLGQMLKSFRDTRVAFPCYENPATESPSLRELGPLEMPHRGG
ncbi:MAG: carbon-nitrogen hydrolase family protein [Ramlibacter sp.]